MPIVGAATGGSSIGGPTHDSGGMLARYQFSPGVSEPVASRSAMISSASERRDQSRKFAHPSSVSHCSAMPGNWNSSMYHDFSRWGSPAPRNASGLPTDI